MLSSEVLCKPQTPAPARCRLRAGGGPRCRSRAGVSAEVLEMVVSGSITIGVFGAVVIIIIQRNVLVVYCALQPTDVRQAIASHTAGH